MSTRHILAMTRKEIHHILRDRMAFFLVMLSPALMLVIMAYALAVDIQNVPVAVLDQDRSAMSRSFIQQITAGEDLDLNYYASSMEEIEDLLMRGSIKAAIVISPRFASDLMAMKGVPIQIIIDGTEPSSGGFAADHIGLRTEEFINTVLANRMQTLGIETLQPIDLRVRTWYNPSMKSEVSIIPGLVSMVMGFPALSVAMTLAREREHGTMEQLMATPISRPDLLIGKMIPYTIVGMVNVFLLTLLAMVFFNVPFNGNFALFFALSVIFLFAIMALGILIGVFVNTQSAAVGLAFLVIFFPGFFLTGIFFPIVAMPELVRLESLFLPGTQYAIITRGAFLTGVGLDVLWPYVVMLFFLWLMFTALAALFFKKRLA
ncbi:MAG: ABC transporter permease [Anaerolineales bacterium]|jgi:ABC-2 type transport system permease protein